MALEFDGSSQYIQVTQNSGLPIYNDTSYSVCGWVKAAAQDDKRIFSEGSSSSNYPLFTIGSGRVSESLQSKLQVYIRNDANTALLGAGGSYVASTTTLFDDTWHHFCWVDNNGDADLYIDGTLDATSFNYTRSGTFTLDRMGMGAVVRAAVSNWLDGELFDIRCYNRCLTPNEIAEIYHHRGADKVWQGLVGRWRLDEAPSGTPAPLLIDSMDSTTGWTPFGSVSLNTTTYREGSGALSLSKTLTTTDYSRMEKTISAVDLTDQTINLWVYIKDSTVLSKMPEISYGFGQNGSNRYRKAITSLVVGWQLLSTHVDDFSVWTGSPTKTNVTFLAIGFDVVNNSTTLATNDVIFDFFHAGDYTSDYIIDGSGNGNHGAPQGGVYRDSPHRLRRGVLVS